MPDDLHIHNSGPCLCKGNSRTDPERMTRDETFHARIGCPFFDNPACRVGVKSRRLDVVSAADVSEQRTISDPRRSLYRFSTFRVSSQI